MFSNIRQSFLKLIQYLRKVILPDAALLLELGALFLILVDYKDHPVLSLPLFLTDKFKEFSARVKAVTAEAPNTVELKMLQDANSILGTIMNGFSKQLALVLNHQSARFDQFEEKKDDVASRNGLLQNRMTHASNILAGVESDPLLLNTQPHNTAQNMSAASNNQPAVSQFKINRAITSVHQLWDEYCIGEPQHNPPKPSIIEMVRIANLQR
jgi:hypothetical protein